MNDINLRIVKKDGSFQNWEPEKIKTAITKSADRVNRVLSDIEKDKVVNMVLSFATNCGKSEIPVDQIHNAVEGALRNIAPEVAESYIGYRNFRKDQARLMDEVWAYKNSLDFMDTEKENANKDGAIVSTKRALVTSQLNTKFYEKYFLNRNEVQDIKNGYYYIHDRDMRLDSMNCCLFDIGNVLKGGFEMANVHYNEPKRIRSAFSVISDIVLSAASQQYGGFTLPEVDKVLSKYAEMSYNEYYQKYLDRNLAEQFSILSTIGAELTEKVKTTLRENAEASARKLAEVDTIADIRQGYQGWEIKFNTVASSRGDYPFITISFGLARDKWGKEICKAILDVHRIGQGAEGKKKAVLFPKLVFLYDEELHGTGKELADVTEAAIECTSQVMYPDWLSMSGEGYIASMYKKYGKAISPMGCRAFLSPWYERGGMQPADENDEPVFVGRFNIGAISLNLPMILAKAREDNRDFYSLLDEYLESIRNIHKRTYSYLGKKLAGTNPLAFCQGGFYGGNLKPNEPIAPILKSATTSFGITALNELQRLYNGRSLVEDGAFALDVMKFINRRVNEFKEEDGNLYAIYGTPAESLCYKQVEQFRAKYGIVKNVSDREYVSNSFHCHVSEDINPIQKQDIEYRFWELCNGGKIQYVRYPISYNRKAVETLLKRAMEMGLYEGANLSLSYCDDCGYEELNMDECCPVCGSKNITKIDRMNGYLAYSKVNGDTRLNKGKMAEIADRVSM